MKQLNTPDHVPQRGLMRELYDSSPLRGTVTPDDSLLGFSAVSFPTFIYLLFFLFVLVLYSANPLEPQAFGFYKLSVFFQVVSFFGLFFVPTLLIYFSLDLTRSIFHTGVVLAYPLLALGGLTILGVPDLPFMASVSGLILFAFYFLLGLNSAVAERQRRVPRARRVSRTPPAHTRYQTPQQHRSRDERAALQRQSSARYPPPTRPQEFRRESRRQYESSDGFLSRLDRFLDRYDYIDGEAVRKDSQRNVAFQRDRRRERR